MRFGRRYLIQILTPQNDLIEITEPFSVEFEIQRNTLASTNTASLTLYNLSPRTRNRIFKDRYTLVEYWQLTIWAGYEKLSKVFQGNIYEAQSFKQATDWHTKITAFDGLAAIQNGYTARSVAANTPRLNIMRDVISDMPNVVAGIFGSPSEGSSDRGQVLLGPSVSVLDEQSNSQYFIDSEIVHVIDRDEVIGSEALVIDQNQLFTTPKRRETFLDIEMLFFPESAIGNLVEVQSQEAIYNGLYKSVGFSHSVQILGSAGGLAKTTMNLYAGAEGLKEAT